MDSKQTSDLRKELRREALARRAEMPAPYRAHKSAAICEALEEALAFTCAAQELSPEQCTIAVYAAFEEEVQLDQFIRAAYAKGVRVAFPCMVSDAHGAEGAPAQTMEMRLVSCEDYAENTASFLANPLKKFTHESPDLAGFPYVSASNLDMIIIPLVAFDAKKNRLGYGGGNYDRYLPQLSSSCRQVGVAFAEQEVDAIPAEPHDIPVTVLAK